MGADKDPLVIGSQRLEGAVGGAEKAGEGRREAKLWDAATRSIYTPLGGVHTSGGDSAQNAANQLAGAAKIASPSSSSSGRAVTLPRRASAGIRARSAAASASKEEGGAWSAILDPLGVFGGK